MVVKYYSEKNCAMAWAVFCRLIKAKARVKSQTNLYGICCGQRGTGVLPRLFNFSVSVSFHHLYILVDSFITRATEY